MLQREGERVGRGYRGDGVTEVTGLTRVTGVTGLTRATWGAG